MIRPCQLTVKVYPSFQLPEESELRELAIRYVGAMPRDESTPPPAPPRSMPTGTRFLLVLVPLIIFGGIGFYVLLPHYLVKSENSGREAVARVLDDVKSAQKLVALVLIDDAPAAADGRVDIYRVLLERVSDAEQIVSLCSRSGVGPTLEQIRAGDYSPFPYERAEGVGSMQNGDKPVFWDRTPTSAGSRILALSNGAVFLASEEQFQAHMLRYGMK